MFKIKSNEDGNINKYKDRLVIKGCSQRKGLDYEETYTPVARLTTVRTLLSLVDSSTQNPNKSFNASVWRMAPKHLHTGHKNVTIAAYVSARKSGENEENEFFEESEGILYGPGLAD